MTFNTAPKQLMTLTDSQQARDIQDQLDKALLSSLLQDSDARYFRAAASSFKINAGELSVMDGLRTQASACVLHSIAQYPAINAIEAWLKELESQFSMHKATWSRFYLPEQNKELAAYLHQSGYHCTTEIAYALTLASNSEQIPNSNLKAASQNGQDRGETELHFQQLIAAAASQSPDGHAMSADDYVELERRKVAAGYMQAFLYSHNSKPVVSVNLDYNSQTGMARLKNMLCHPEARGQRLGRQVVRALKIVAERQGANYFGAYALETNGPAKAMYEANGLVEVGRQYEWVKSLAKA